MQVAGVTQPSAELSSTKPPTPYLHLHTHTENSATQRSAIPDPIPL